MSAVRVMALALVAVGGVLLWYGNAEQKTLTNQLSETLLGESTRDVTVFYVSGGAAVAIGLLGLALGGKRR